MSTTPTLRMTRRAADRLRAGHLWVYKTDLEPTNAAPPAPGALVTLTDTRDLPLGTALYSSASMLTARLVSRTPGLTRAQYLADLRTRIDAALQLRRTLTPVLASSNAHRLLFSEADNLPGIVADRYNDLVLLQLLTQGTAQDDVRTVITAALSEHFAAEGWPLTLWERPDPRIRELEELPPPPPGALYSSVIQTLPSRPGPSSLSTNLSSQPEPSSLSTNLSSRPERSEVERPLYLSGGDNTAPTTTTFTLNGLSFHYDAASGQKTGAFLDQRLNYAAAARAVHASTKTKRALDICTYQGGFALHLAQVCEQVTGVDASLAALEAADRNLALNPDLAHREIDWVEADAFDYLRHLDDLATQSRSTSDLFDAIVLDPPAFAKSKRAVASAARGYKELNLRALRLLTPGGTLITNSCSHHVSLEEFTAIVASAAADAGRRVQLLETRAAAPDHPEVLTLPETRYLKCLICRVD